MKFSAALVLLFSYSAFAASSFDCGRLAGAPLQNENFVLALSKAHSEIRFFGVNETYGQADQALARLFDQQDPLSSVNLESYIQAVNEVCLTTPNTLATTKASLTMRGQVAWISPGPGKLMLPKSARAAVLDLRNLPAVSDYENILRSTFGTVLREPFELPVHQMRTHLGMTDEGFRPTRGYYGNRVAGLNEPEIPATLDREIPIVIIVGHTLAPKTAEFAAALRIKGKAYLAGEMIPIGVAESHPTALGIYFRSTDLTYDGKRLPDTVPADFPLQKLETLDFTKLTPPTEIQLNDEGTRPRVLAAEPNGKVQAPANPVGDLRAALIVAHGSAMLFDPNFPPADKEKVNQRLFEQLKSATANSSHRVKFRNALRRLGEPLNDGHNYTFDRTYKTIPEGAGVLPILFADNSNVITVAASNAQGVTAGDRLVAVDGIAVEQWLQTETSRTSALTEGYKIDRALRELQIQREDRHLTFLTPNNQIKEAVLTPSPLETLLELKRPDYVRPSGWASGREVYYLNVAGSVLKTIEEFETHMREAQNANSLILDLRNSPNISAVEMAKRLIPYTFKGPQFFTPVFNGPVKKETFSEIQGPFEPLPNAYTGKIFLLTGPLTVSAAEHFASYLIDANRVTIVGRHSAGTNGSMTGIQLPGSFLFTFTGMDARHADGTPYRGVAPQFSAVSTYLDYANGTDAVLNEAILKAKSAPP